MFVSSICSFSLVWSFQVLFEGKTAFGVEYVHGGRLRRVKAKKEIVLSAGAIGSPHILLLSGVGPKKHLEQHGVSVCDSV